MWETLRALNQHRRARTVSAKAECTASGPFAGPDGLIPTRPTYACGGPARPRRRLRRSGCRVPARVRREEGVGGEAQRPDPPPSADPHRVRGGRRGAALVRLDLGRRARCQHPCACAQRRPAGKAAVGRLGSGHTVGSEIEAPTLSGHLV
jgi:hypothetical protein